MVFFRFTKQNLNYQYITASQYRSSLYITVTLESVIRDNIPKEKDKAHMHFVKVYSHNPSQNPVDYYFHLSL